MWADPTEEGIAVGDTLDDRGSGPTEEHDEDSDFDESGKLLALERRQSGDGVGFRLISPPCKIV